MTYPQSFAQADEMLTGRCKSRRKLANNTYAERRDDAIAVRLHATDVVTFHNDGRTVLDSGGWLTVTTKDRMNECLPNGYRLGSDRGRWYLYPGTRNPESRIPYADGLTIHADGSVTGVDLDAADREDQANKRVNRDITKFVKAITPEAIVKAWEDAGGDCFLCRFGETRCLSEHVREGYFHATLARNAIAAAGYISPDAIMALTYGQAQRGSVSTALTRALRKYLRKNLTTGVAVA